MLSFGALTRCTTLKITEKKSLRDTLFGVTVERATCSPKIFVHGEQSILDATIVPVKITIFFNLF